MMDKALFVDTDFSPYLTNRFSNHHNSDESTFILGASGTIFKLYSILSMKFL